MSLTQLLLQADYFQGQLGITALVTVKILHWCWLTLFITSRLISNVLAAFFLLTGKITDVGSMGRLREGNSSFCNRLSAELTKCVLGCCCLQVNFSGLFYVSTF